MANTTSLTSSDVALLMFPGWTDLDALIKHARSVATGVEAVEIAPGVMLLEAKACLLHAVVVQHGASTVENEAQRLSKDRHRKAPS